MERVVDYAGLFPPARLPMPDAVRAYADVHAAGDAWMLGRFVIPVSRLDEFDDAGAGLLPVSAATSWALSALVSADVELDVTSIHAFNDRHRDARRGAVHVDSVELKAARADEITTADEFVGGFDAFFEVPVDEDPAALISAIAGIGAKAKIRTGGITHDAFPGARHVVRFIGCCLKHGVAFKATAGLHHPLRAEYPLTYESDAPRGTMFGYLNLFLTAAFMSRGLDDGSALALLEERDASALRFDTEGVRWDGHLLSADDLRHARRQAVAFGSCSFREPVDDLRALGLL